ncbi:hypothetical protein KVT40_005232 [Elsinoe batatas]|uniref:NB-ARC domain-containing protein n=1 Tax=Elsinoe batatas TaxID=2601811 RepID=A0A8K0KZI1_9PEZI|nr:hypothetical protein KVT40_005232 [Elsinoe batatas]
MSRAGSLQTTRVKLRSLHKEYRVAHLLAVPGVFSSPAATWKIEEVLVSVFEAAGGVTELRIHQWNFPRTINEKFSWQSLLDSAVELVEQLQNQVSTAQDTDPLNGSIFIVSHSLGGLVVKQATNLLSQQMSGTPLYSNKVQGIIFLGCPNRLDSDEDTWQEYNDVVKNLTAPSGIKIAPLSSGDREAVLSVGTQFLHSAGDVPILSVYEGMPMKLKSRFRSKEPFVVNKNFASAHSARESLLQAQLDHGDLPYLFKDALLASKNYKDHWLIKYAAERIDSVQTGPEQRASSDTRSFSVASTLLEPVPPRPASSAIPVRHKQRPRPPVHFVLRRRSRNADFHGRHDELAAIEAALVPRDSMSAAGGDEEVRCFALTGMGGIGKTDLALEFVHTRTLCFDAIFWLDAGETTQLSADFCHIGVKVGLVENEAHLDFSTTTELVMDWLQRGCRNDKGVRGFRRWLLVFDNADDLDAIDAYIPPTGPGSILVTSRDPSAKTLMAFASTGIEVGESAQDDAAELLRKMTDCEQNPTEGDASRKLVEELGCLPLAIAQMAGVVRKRDITLEESISLIQSGPRYASFRGMTSPIQKRRYGSTLAAAWNFDILNKESFNLLRIISVLHPDGIQETLFDSKAAASSKGELHSLRMSVLQSLDSFSDARAELIASFIIKRDKKVKEMTIHRVIAQEARARMSKSELREIICLAANLLSRHWPFMSLEGRHKVERWPKCQKAVY